MHFFLTTHRTDQHFQEFSRFKISRVEKITHPPHLDKYKKRGEEIKQRIANETEKFYPINAAFELNHIQGFETTNGINEVWLFHGSRQDKSSFSTIVENGLSKDFSKTGLLGRGIYFAEDILKSDYYCRWYKSEYENLSNDHLAEKKKELRAQILSKNPLLRFPTSSNNQKIGKLLSEQILDLNEKNEYTLVLSKVILGSAFHASTKGLDPNQSSSPQGIDLPFCQHSFLIDFSFKIISPKTKKKKRKRRDQFSFLIS